MSFDRSVFVNCPYDAEFLPLLHAMAFVIHDCGFVFRSALETTDSSETRLAKIHRLILDCRWSIHDLSRVELSDGLPRLNMAFECGLAFGAVAFAGGSRGMLVMTDHPYSDKRSISDLAGQDAEYHNDDAKKLINVVRKFLAERAPEFSKRDVAGADALWRRYRSFDAKLPGMAKTLRISVEEIRSFDYFSDWLRLATQWQVKPDTLVRSPTPKKSS